MTEEQQIKNIIAFLAIMFGESELWYEHIINIPPDYLIEKFHRYIMSTRSESDWGLHPNLRRGIFESYLIKHGISHKQYDDIE